MNKEQQHSLNSSFIGAVILVSLLAASAILFMRSLFTNDVWWHIALGDEILAHRRLPLETFSYTGLGEAIFSNWWLTDAVFSVVAATFGLNGLEALGFLLTAGVAMLVGFCARRLGASECVSLVMSAYFVLCAETLLILRPQLFSFFFLALLFFCFLSQLPRLRWSFVLTGILFVPWANFHGGFLLGLLLLVGLGGFEMLLALRTGAAVHKENLKILFATLALGLLVLNLNPYGIEIFAQVLRHDPAAQGVNRHIDEWLPGAVSVLWPFYAAVIASIVLLATGRAQARGLEAALFLASVVAGLIAWRHVAVFSVLALPCLGAWATRVMRSYLFEFCALRSRVSLPVASLLLCGLVTWQLCFRGPALESTELRRRFPILAAEWIKRNPQDGHLYNPFEWGGYLGFAFRGNPPIFIDSRITPFTLVFPEQYFEIANAARSWKELLIAHGITWAVVPKQSKLALALVSELNWEIRYEDSLAVVLHQR